MNKIHFIRKFHIFNKNKNITCSFIQLVNQIEHQSHYAMFLSSHSSINVLLPLFQAERYTLFFPIFFEQQGPRPRVNSWHLAPTSLFLTNLPLLSSPTPYICTKNSVFTLRLASFSPSDRFPHKESISSMKIIEGFFSRAIVNSVLINLN